ncbi:Zinc finger C2H2-type [Sesbania bispinosa]|nr:Zinc finger C2H2-type [Sesbania bispinosa]
MATPQNRLNKNVPAASSQDSCEGSAAIEHPPPPAAAKIRVCPHCKREFINGRAFGGHVRIHSKGGTKIRFTHKKSSSSGAATTTTIQRAGEGAVSDDDDLSVSINGRGWHAARRMRALIHNSESDDEEVVSTSNKRNHFDLNMPPN